MKSIILMLAILLSSSLQAQVPSGTNCDYYKHLEDQKRCLSSGSDYLVNYGHFYCTIFLQRAQSWGGERAAWLEKVALCLQEKVDEARDLSCKKMERHAFRTHSDCYAETGFCELSPADRRSILKTLVRAPLFRRLPQTLIEAHQIFGHCRQLAGLQGNLDPLNL